MRILVLIFMFISHSLYADIDLKGLIVWNPASSFPSVLQLKDKKHYNNYEIVIEGPNSIYDEDTVMMQADHFSAPLVYKSTQWITFKSYAFDFSFDKSWDVLPRNWTDLPLEKSPYFIALATPTSYTVIDKFTLPIYEEEPVDVYAVEAKNKILGTSTVYFSFKLGVIGFTKFDDKKGGLFILGTKKTFLSESFMKEDSKRKNKGR